MRIIQSVAPELNVALTNDNKLVIMVDTDDGEVLAEVTDIDHLVASLRRMELIQMELSARPSNMITTAEVELNRRQAQ